MKFAVAFVAILACAYASPSGYGGYGAYGHYPYGGPAYAHDPPAPITVLPNGFLADTPEVAHAKAAHLSEKAKVASKGGYGYSGAGYGPAPYAYAAPAYAPAAYAPAAYAAPAKYGSYGGPYAGAYAKGYAYEPAHITVLPNGYLADTPEVAHSKAAHEVAKGYVAAAAAANPDYDSHSYGHGGYAPAPYAYGGPKYYGSHY
ncbi:hypothetical protein M8J76_008285 [Diaphorina citri]|nr:hypothetical protein M8J76_008285 [Diaphorina citri]KAI5743036.1 hypothetical protein M8J77_013827 [Diaphorina citri]